MTCPSCSQARSGWQFLSSAVRPCGGEGAARPQASPAGEGGMAWSCGERGQGSAPTWPRGEDGVKEGVGGKKGCGPAPQGLSQACGAWGLGIWQGREGGHINGYCSPATHQISWLERSPPGRMPRLSRPHLAHRPEVENLWVKLKLKLRPKFFCARGTKSTFVWKKKKK